MEPAQKLSYGWDFTCQQEALVIVTTRAPFFPATSLTTTKKSKETMKNRVFQKVNFVLSL